MPHERIAELHRALVEEPGDSARARMHLELARLYVREARFDAAARHFREALAFEPSLLAARHGLNELGQAHDTGRRRRDVLLGWLRGK